MIPNTKKIYLCAPDLSKICVLNGIQTNTVDFHPQIKGYSELSFEVDRYLSIDGQLIESNGYNDLKPYMYLLLEDIGYFIMEPPEVQYNGNFETKSVTAYSAEKEFENKDWVGIKINYGTSDSMEYSNTDEYNKEEHGFAIRYVTMFDETDENLSFLTQILKKMSSKWTIGYLAPEIKHAKIPFLEIDSENLYAVMTSEVAPRLSCLFVFDYLHFTINVFHKDYIDNAFDLDSGIFIGFRNLENNVSINVDSDSIFTRFSVQGQDNLEFRDVNYGENTIINMDYFLSEPYMDDDMVTKYRAWQEFRQNHIADYKALAKEYNELVEKREERIYRVPSDESYWTNWENINTEGLISNLNYFRQQIELLQISVDNREAEQMYDSNNNYLPILQSGKSLSKINGLTEGTQYKIKSTNANSTIVYDFNDATPADIVISTSELTNCGYTAAAGFVFVYVADLETAVDHEVYLQRLYDKVNIYGGYYTYKEIINYIIPYIKIALANTDKPEDEQITPDYDISQDWDLYGLEELKGVRDSYQDKIKSLDRYSKAWDEMTEEEKQNSGLNYTDEGAGEQYEQIYGRQEYKKLKAAIGDEDTPDTILYQIKQLEDEIKSIEDRMSEISALTNEYAVIVKYNLDTNTLDSLVALPEDTINERRNSLFTERQLLTFDSLLRDTDYVNSNILTTSIMSLDEKLQVEEDLLADSEEKLSEVSQPQFTFSVGLDNFFRLTDYAEWASEFEPESGAINKPPIGLLKYIMVELREGYAVKLRVIGYRWNPCEVTPDLTLEFSNMITSRSGRSDLTQLLDQENNRGSKNSIQIGTGTADSAQEYVSALMDLLKNNSIFLKTVRNIAGGTTGGTDTVTVENIINDYINAHGMPASSINVDNVIGLDGKFQSLVSQYIDANYISSKIIDAETGQFKYLDSIYVNASHITGETGDFDELTAKIITADNATLNNIIAQAINATTITADKIIGNEAQFNALFAKEGFINNLTTNVTTTLLSEQAQANILNAVIGKLAVGDLKAGNIVLTDTMQILSDNGAMVMNGKALQFGKENEEGDFYVNVQLGYGVDDDGNEIPSLIIRDDDGAVLFTSQGIIGEDGYPIQKGISAGAIADQLIVNGMIHDKTISEEKLGFNVMKQGDSITIDQVYTEAGGEKFGVEWERFTSTTTTELNNLKNLAKSVALFGQQVFVESQGTITPESVTITAELKNGANISKWYVDNTERTTGLNQDGDQLTISSSEIANKKTLQIKVVTTDGLYDVLTLYRVVDGENGDSPYTVILTSSKGELFKEEDETVITCTVYHGTDTVVPDSYEWLQWNDETEQFEVIEDETEDHITINVTSQRVKQRIKCSVEV